MFVVVLESSSCSTAAMRFSSFPCPFFESSLLSRPCWRSTSPAPFCSLSRDCVWRGSSGIGASLHVLFYYVLFHLSFSRSVLI
ncbi:hypothetical protein R1flu_010424 [Riccia fluitans]|uniref:Secreted protein n=1 Tax=Riccia fluitans TaxID=41844 RepID=A0ABD1Z4Y0_9MARC